MTATWFDGLSLKVELGLASNPTTAIGSTLWTDITIYVRGIQIHRGRSDEDNRFQAGTMSVVLDNADRRFDPNHTTGPFYGNLLPKRRIRVVFTYAGVDYPVWAGFVNDWPQSYDIGNRDATVELSATDGFEALQQTSMPDLYARQVIADNPAAYYRLGEQDYNLAVDSSANKRDGTYQGGTTAKSQPSIVASTNNRSILFGSGDFLQVPFPVTYPFTIEMWAQVTSTPAGSAVLWQQPAGAGNEATISIDSGLQLTASVANGASVLESVTINQVILGAIGHIMVYFPDGSTPPSVYYNAVAQGTTTTTIGAPVPLSGLYQVLGTGQLLPPSEYSFPGIIDEFAVYLSNATGLASSHYALGSATWAGDATGARIGRVLDAISWPSADRDIASGISTMTAVPVGNVTALGLLQTAETSEQSQLFMGADGKVVFRDRHWRFENTKAINSQATFGDAGGELPYSNIQTDGGARFIVNHVTAERQGGGYVEQSDATSIAKFYERTSSIDGLQNQLDAEVQGFVGWRLATRKNPIQRVTVLEVRPRARPSMIPTILGLDIGHRDTVNRRPQGVGAALSYTTLVEGIDHTIDPYGEWVVTFYLSSADSNPSVQPGIYDHVTFGLYDAAVYGP